MKGLLILGDQLFPDVVWKKHLSLPAFMAEDLGLCTHFKYHKHKIIFFLASMRQFHQEMKESGLKIDYSALDAKDGDKSFIARLEKWIETKKITEIVSFAVDDMFFEAELAKSFKKLAVTWTIMASPKFMTSRQDFTDYLAQGKKPFMKTFYEGQRKKSGILMDAKGKPVGGKYSFDADNRKKLPKDLIPPSLPKVEITPLVKEVMKLVDKKFAAHPGKSEDFWLETSRSRAKVVAGDFFKNRLALFGDYEDALTPHSDFVYHSTLSPYMNIGFLPPEMLMQQVPKLLERKMPLNSVEGFVRQVIGWREFIHGIYRGFNHIQVEKNFFDHKRRLTKHWYDGTTGVPVLDDAIKKADRLGYCHHIERLMVLSNIMLLCEVHPHDVHRWFMEMFVDSADWVMGPNVWGMAQFSDGGIFATKPYICGSNYIRKMSSYPEGPWCDVMDGLYWRFMEKHREFFAKNMRMGAAMGSLDKMDKERRQRIFSAAEDFIKRVTHLS
ncbi:MAG: cryptochrome/photolyase family protein [Bacteriovoracia bacterium]